MSKRLFLISCLLWKLATCMAAQDSIPRIGYDHRVENYRKHWAALIPTQTVLQNAGNMGVLSCGIGWDYGHKRNWETHLLFGFIPRYQSSRGKVTTTLKENYIPFSLYLGRGWSVQPLTCSIYFNTVYGHEFWRNQPNRYPDKYYDFLSTKVRANVAIGQRITIDIPENRRKFVKGISAFYEVGSCDLYLRAKWMDGTVKWKDVLGLSLGLKMQML